MTPSSVRRRVTEQEACAHARRGQHQHDRQSVNRRHVGGEQVGLRLLLNAAEWVLAAAQIDSVRYRSQMWCPCVLEDWGSTGWLLFKFSSRIHQFWHKCSLLRGNSVMFSRSHLNYFGIFSICRRLSAGPKQALQLCALRGPNKPSLVQLDVHTIRSISQKYGNSYLENCEIFSVKDYI